MANTENHFIFQLNAAHFASPMVTKSVKARGNNVLYSAALIVKNEERVLSRCLETLRGVVDEIVVVDTGSTDSTRRIAETFASTIHSYLWNDDFAAARNFALSKASGEYVLSIDADEYLIGPASARSQLDTFVRRHDPGIVGTVDIVSPTGTGAASAQSVFAAQRFFRRERFRFVGAIHEQLVPVFGEKLAAPTGLRLMHTGYAQDLSSPDHKSHRNKRMLLAELARHPDDEYYLYQLGRAHFALHEYADAATAFERAWRSLVFSNGQPPTGRLGPVAAPILPDMVTMLAYARVNAGQLDAAVAHVNECENHPHEVMAGLLKASPDFHHARGYVHLMQGDLGRSRSAYQEALHVGPEHEQGLGTGGFGSLYHLGLLAEAEGSVDEAVDYYCRALAANPTYEPAIARNVDLVIEKHRRPSRKVYETADREIFHNVYLQRFRQCLDRKDSKGAALLLEGAQGLSPTLYALCMEATGR